MSRQRAPIGYFPQTLQQIITNIRQIENSVKTGNFNDRDLDTIASELEDAVYETRVALFNLESQTYAADPNYPHGLTQNRAGQGLTNYRQY